MRQLNRWQTAVFAVGAVMMVAGAAGSLVWPAAAFWIYAAGAAAFVSMQLMQSYEGSSFVLRRLRRIVVMSDQLLLFTAVLMYASLGNPLGLDHVTYVSYVHNNWVVTLLLAAVLQLYSAHRIDRELRQEAKKL